MVIKDRFCFVGDILIATGDYVVLLHLLIGFDLGVSEESHGGAPAQCSIGNFFLPGNDNNDKHTNDSCEEKFLITALMMTINVCGNDGDMMKPLKKLLFALSCTIMTNINKDK